MIETSGCQTVRVAWQDTPFSRLVGVRFPIVGAPMAGGPSTPRLAAAVSAAGGLGSVAGAMLGPDQLRDAIRETRSLTDRPFAVNLFAPLPAPSGERVADWAALTGVPVPGPTPRPRFTDQLAVVVDERVPVFSFTFGVPDLVGLDAVTIGTATTVAEAVELQRAGVRAIVAQGFDAGGHRGTFLAPVAESLVGTFSLVPQIVDAVSVPVLGSGGIMDGRGIAAALTLGAAGVQLGTALLRCPEAGTAPAHRQALDRPTTITDVLTGRPARAVRTPLVDRLEASGLRPPDYPLPRYLSPEPPMLAGQAARLARSLPAADLIHALVDEVEAARRA
ncbi:MAG: nitronate monooxygenase [Mycobacteriales bacterium]|jgi:nitronate monooxygenase